MMKLANFIKGTSVLYALFFVVSCEHEPLPSCTEVIINVEVTKTDADPGQSNGTLIVSANGEGKFFTYSINDKDFQASNKFVGLDSGKYVVTAKNSWGCLGSQEVILKKTNPCTGITLSATVTNATLGKSDGRIVANLTGATGYTFSINGGTYQANTTFNGVAAGNYTVNAKNSLGCVFTAQAVVGSTDPCVGVTVVVNATSVNPALSQSNGSITATATGATGFTYKLNAGAFQSSGSFTGLAAGTYVITAKSANGCIGTTQVTLTGTNLCAGVTVVVTTSTTDPTTGLNNGSITASATGGTGFTYSINNGAFQTSGSFTGLATGNYTITAKNADGCLGTKQVALGSTNPCSGVTVAVTATITNATLAQSNGTIAATATGGTGFTYSLNNGAYQVSGTFSGLAAGNYTVTAKNSNGCLGSAQFTVGSIDPCTGVTVVVAGTVVNATSGQTNGSIAATATGGTGFTYSLNNGAFQSSGTFTGLAGGAYTITAKNSSGCLGTSQFTVTSINPCTNTTITISTTTTSSDNCVTTGTGSIVATATGSTGITYNINNGTYQTSGTFSNLTVGNYTIGAKDINGCTKTVTATVGVLPAGLTYAPLKALIQSRCSGSGCHTNGQTQKGYNFDTDCNIIKAWSGIEGSTITGKLNKMPISPQPNLTTAEKQIITDWINAGHGYSN